MSRGVVLGNERARMGRQKPESLLETSAAPRCGRRTSGPRGTGVPACPRAIPSPEGEGETDVCARSQESVENNPSPERTTNIQTVSEESIAPAGASWFRQWKPADAYCGPRFELIGTSTATSSRTF